MSQQFNVRSKSKNFSGRIAGIGAVLFLLALTINSAIAALQEPAPHTSPQSQSDNRLAIRLPLTLNERIEMVREGPVETVPSRYTHEVSVAGVSCDPKLPGITPEKDGSTCWLSINRSIWTDGLVTGEPEHFKQATRPGENVFVLGFDMSATLYLNNPAISPRYPLSSSALGNHVVHYTPHVVEWINFE